MMGDSSGGGFPMPPDPISKAIGGAVGGAMGGSGGSTSGTSGSGTGGVNIDTNGVLANALGTQINSGQDLSKQNLKPLQQGTSYQSTTNNEDGTSKW